MRARKAVFVEKPLCLTLGELEEISNVFAGRDVPSVALDSGIPAGMTEMEALVLGSALPSMALDSGIPAGMTGVGRGMTQGEVVLAGMQQDKVVPAGMPGPSARDGERAGHTQVSVLDSALPSMALDSGIPAGMTGRGRGGAGRGRSGWDGAG